MIEELALGNAVENILEDIGKIPDPTDIEAVFFSDMEADKKDLAAYGKEKGQVDILYHLYLQQPETFIRPKGRTMKPIWNTTEPSRN